MKSRLIVFGALLIMLGAGDAHADGFIPAIPYHYLHPPAGIRHNKKPGSGRLGLALRRGSTPVELVLFTSDGQAGIDVPQGALSAAKPAREVVARISAINPPRTIPAPRLLDGNVYRFSVDATPARAGVKLRGSFSLILRWPHSPNAVLQFVGGHWRTLCSYGHWTLSISTVSCRTRSFGTFAAVRLPIKSRG